MEKDVTSVMPEPSEIDKAWQAYLQSCCESGQLFTMVEQMESQTRDLQKKYEITNAKSKSLLTKYNQLKQNGHPKLNPDLTPKEAAPEGKPLQ